ncbi:hypothetical protein ACKKBG_A34000 [Auxenochlorella protothecoides x Auxenochlorella symbiontica]
MATEEAILASLEARTAQAEQRIAALEGTINAASAQVQPGSQGTPAERREAELLKENEKLRYQIKHLKRALLETEKDRVIPAI